MAARPGGKITLKEANPPRNFRCIQQLVRQDRLVQVLTLRRIAARKNNRAAHTAS